MKKNEAGGGKLFCTWVPLEELGNAFKIAVTWAVSALPHNEKPCVMVTSGRGGAGDDFTPVEEDNTVIAGDFMFWRGEAAVPLMDNILWTA